MLYSAGECPVCSIAGDALFVKNPDSGLIFFLCPSCGCAWLQPPRPYTVETVDPPTLFAPRGITLPSKADIPASEQREVVAREVEDDEWLVSLQDYLVDETARSGAE